PDKVPFVGIAERQIIVLSGKIAFVGDRNDVVKRIADAFGCGRCSGRVEVNNRSWPVENIVSVLHACGAGCAESGCRLKYFLIYGVIGESPYDVVRIVEDKAGPGADLRDAAVPVDSLDMM